MLYKKTIFYFEFFLITNKIKKFNQYSKIKLILKYNFVNMKFKLFKEDNDTILIDSKSFGCCIPNNKKSLAQFCSECFQVFCTDVQIKSCFVIVPA